MLRYVTVTGFDNATNLIDFLTIVKKYPFAEWGVLISDLSCANYKPRYPNYHVFRDLAKCKNILPQINLSLHVCSFYLRKIIHHGDWRVFTDLNYDDRINVTNSFSRIQLNLSNMIGEIQEPFFESLKNIDQEIILQLKSVEGKENCQKYGQIQLKIVDMLVG